MWLVSTKQPLRSVNNTLSVVVCVLGLYITLAPVLPQFLWWLHKPNVQSAQITSGKKEPIPKENLLVIPRMGLRETINTGPTIRELRKGVWLIPKTSTPDKASNTVMAGHRFTYAGPAVFYFLDKVQLDDMITIDWQSKEYTYKVSTIKEVPPTAVEIQNPSEKPMLTLYTCTPLWSAKNRLVVQAMLVKERS